MIQEESITQIVKIKLKTTMLKSSLCDYSDGYIFLKWRITITAAGADAPARQADERKKGVMFRNCALFTNCTSKINNAQQMQKILML